ncbi:glycosyltransferase family 2 protein [Mariprofundus sp. KV]|uniref:glycosyltransferase family 2 protein n=1 Tax=Mariprofundus sp. KV TaxID=2608715 RepID=UPI0015A4218B|nr:glycosyltransferase family 2 protein [Mariprofundus sp. KV]NWF35534.1 glycosyltransferase [Mariprofundus sp. KV]
MKISIITAVYNGAATIGDAIKSVLDQSHPNIELIVIDGASTDGTLAVLESYRDRIDIVISEPDSGIYDALNKGIARASGDVVGFLHADDLYAGNDVLATVAEAFTDPAVDAAYGDLVYVSKSEPDRVIRYWQAGDFRADKLKQGWMPPHPTFYMRREFYERLGGFDTGFRIAADYDCMLRMLGQPGFCCHYIPQLMVRMRVGGESNRSLLNIIRKSREDYDVLKRNGVGGIGALLWKNFSKLPQFFRRGE